MSSDEESRVTSAAWLRGAKRGILAGVGVGTIDQALLSMLPVRHNALRMFGLAGKTVVIDEVHAFDAYMRGLLKDLLSWLGELGVPVVLLSATLPRAVAGELVAAYTDMEGSADTSVPYPGWMYVECSTIPAPARSVSYPDERRRPIDVDLRGIATDSEGHVDRVPALHELLRPIADDGGCAAVICTTVAQAQDTYLAVREWARQHDVHLHLLHSRFPAYQREALTRDVVNLFGKPDETRIDRPLRTVLIATQVVEQSLDIDLDLVVTDLAPIELLLQRAGRLQRHPDWDPHRPGWAEPGRGGKRRLVVLTAPDQNVEKLPRSWRYIYPQASLVRAHSLVKHHEATGIRIPEDVQSLVDRGNPGPWPDPDDDLLCGFAEAELERAAGCMVETQTAQRVSIGRSDDLASLAGLSADQIDEERAATRFNADSQRVLPCFVHPDGDIRLGSPHGAPLPPPTGGRLAHQDAVEVMRHSVPVPGSLVRDRDSRHVLPEPWQDLWPFTDLVALPHRVDQNGQVHSVQVGTRELHLDAELGLRG